MYTSNGQSMPFVVQHLSFFQVHKTGNCSCPVAKLTHTHTNPYTVHMLKNDEKSNIVELRVINNNNNNNNSSNNADDKNMRCFLHSKENNKN